MGKITLDDGRSFNVDDSFGKLPLDQQQQIVGELKQRLTSGVAAEIKGQPPAAQMRQPQKPNELVDVPGVGPVPTRASEIATSAIKNIPSSAVKFASDVVQPIAHPIATATNLANLGKGVLQKLGIMEGEDATPYADAVGKFLVDRYGSGEAIKKTIATDPVGMAADISTVLTGGGSLAARAPGVVGRLGEIASTAGRVTNPLSAVGAVAKGAGTLGSEVLGVTTGAGGEAIRTAAKAGATGGAEGRAFLDAMTGREPVEQVVADAKNAVSNLRQQRGKLYREGMENVKESKSVLDFNKIDSAVEKVSSVKRFKGQDLSPTTAAIRGAIDKTIDDWKNLDPKEFHTAEGLDALKQKIGNIRDATDFGKPERVVADEVYHAIRQTIVDNFPRYGKIMKGYEEATQTIKEIEKTLSVNPKASIDTALRKIASALRDNVNTNYGRRKELVAFLARSGATNLLQKIAGQSLSAVMPRGIARLAVSGEGAGALAALASGNPAVAAGLAATLGAHSPFLTGAAAYGAGAATRLPLRGAGLGLRAIGSQ